MISRRAYVWSVLALATVLFFGINIFVDNYFTDARIDLTQNGQYTLAPGTRAIIAKLPEPVTLRFFYSKKLGQRYADTAAYAQRVRDLLSEYAALSHGKIILEDVDPEPYTPEEDEARAAGIRPVATDSGDSVYFGLEGANSVDDKETISYFDPDRAPQLEYDITSLLYGLSHPEKPKLAIITALPLADGGQNGRPLTIYSELEQLYTVTMLPADFPAIPAGTDVLMIAHPQNLGATQLKAIEHFALQKGRILVFVDPASEIVRQQRNSSIPPASDLVPLLRGWGVSYTESNIVLDRGTAQRITTSDPTQPPMAYPLWLHLTTDNLSRTDPITADLHAMNLASVGSLAPIKGASTRFEPLIVSSDQASPVPTNRVMDIDDPMQMMQEVKPTGKRYTIAARIVGKSAFPGVEKGQVNIIVVADTDIFDDRFWVRDSGSGPEPFADNAGFILNAMENLSGSDDLISLRARGTAERPFTVVQKMQAEAELKFRETLQSLQARLTADEQEMAQLQQGGGGDQTTLTPAQQAEIARVREEIAGTRSALRDMQHNLRADIDRLGDFLAFLNIAAVPFLVAGFAIVLSIIRRRRAARRTA